MHLPLRTFTSFQAENPGDSLLLQSERAQSLFITLRPVKLNVI
jgi:hypothetical protein